MHLPIPKQPQHKGARESKARITTSQAKRQAPSHQQARRSRRARAAAATTRRAPATTSTADATILAPKPIPSEKTNGHRREQWIRESSSPILPPALKVRKRDVVLKFGGAGAASGISGASIRVMQMDSSFPFGSCINGGVIQNPTFVDFFTNHFDWAVFENELKWYWTEAQEGQLNYNDADALLDLCDRYGKPVRGHCIFWAVDNAVQQWIKNLDNDQLKSAVEGRLQSLLTRYAGRFPHYDVNNEMLHGSFYQDRLGDDINAFMFRETARLDPGATLFVNDYNVECGNDPNATPEKYIEQINMLQQKGAAVGGIGLQGHVTNPVGEVICDALDKLATTDLPIWLTELDVCESDVDLRADDLEVVLREAYAHPAVEGVMFWGFMQGHMWRQDASLVNSDGTVNDAGERFVDLRREWTSHARGNIDSDGHFKFRGYHGTYIVQLTTTTGKMHKTFTVEKGDTPLVLDMDV